MGILGVDCVLQNDGKVATLEFRSFFSDHDCQIVLNALDENLYDLFESCTNGAFGDVYQQIGLADVASASCVMRASVEDAVVEGLDKIEDAEISYCPVKKNEFFEILTRTGKAFTLTSSANTLARARNKLYEHIGLINYKGKKFRADICPVVE